MAEDGEPLNSEESKREFEKRYGKERGDRIWGETMNKVAHEQAANSPSGVKRETIPGHISFSSRGSRERVRGHYAYVHAAPHSRGHHAGPCDGSCRAGMRAHKHRRGSSRRG